VKIDREIRSLEKVSREEDTVILKERLKA